MGSCTAQSTDNTTKMVTTTEATTALETTTDETSLTENTIILESISIDQTTLLDVYQLNQFQFEDIDLILHFSQGFQSHIALEESMIVESLFNIIEPGTYTFNVEYLNQRTAFTVELIEYANVISISVDKDSYNPYALISTFDISQIMLDVRLENDEINQIPLSFEMISEVDANKLFVEGYHHIKVEYQGFETFLQLR